MPLCAVTLIFFQAICDDLDSQQPDLDALSDKAGALARLSSDSRVASQASQLSTRFHTLSLNAKV